MRWCKQAEICGLHVSITDIKVCVKLKISPSVNVSHNRMLYVQTV